MRGEQDEEGQLDRLPLGVGDRGDQEPEPQRREDQEADDTGDERGVAEHRDPDRANEQQNRQRRDRTTQDAERDKLAEDELDGVDRRDPKQFEDASGPLADDRECDEGDRHVLEDEG